MNARPPDDFDEQRSRRLAALIEQLPREDADGIICGLAAANSRRRIANAWIADKIGGERAMQLLVDHGLIEHDPALLEARGDDG